MSELLDAGATVLTAAGLVVLVIVIPLAGWRSAIATALELWIAAGLLRLSEPSWDRIATAAVLLGVRHLLGAGITTSAR